MMQISTPQPPIRCRRIGRAAGLTTGVRQCHCRPAAADAARGITRLARLPGVTYEGHHVEDRGRWVAMTGW